MKKLMILIALVAVAIVVTFFIVSGKTGVFHKKDIMEETETTEGVKPSSESSSEHQTEQVSEEVKNVSEDPTTEEITTESTTESTVESTSVERVIVLDPGHQAKIDNTKEPIGPGAKKSKTVAGVGTAGVATKTPEYELVLQLSVKLKAELENRGYKVLLTRDTNDIAISSKERADIANNANADAFIRIHANGSNDSSVTGAMTICITKNNPYVSVTGQDYNKSYALSECILNKLVENTGTRKEHIWETDSMSGNNWSSVPTTLVEVGYMSNPEEDKLMATDEYQKKIVDGIANGVDDYVEKQLNVEVNETER